MNTREAFEAIISAPPFEADVSRHPDSGAEWPGCYKDYQVHFAWDLFQAGAAWAARECAQIVNDEDVAPTDDPLGVRHVIELHIRARFPGAFGTGSLPVQDKQTATEGK